jgi:hypothetical protein
MKTTHIRVYEESKDFFNREKLEDDEPMADVVKRMIISWNSERR